MGEGKTLLPGPIDCHTHTFTPEHLKQAIVFGVTLELDMFTDHAFAARMRSEEAAGKALDRADLRSAGTLVTAPGGHGTEYGLKIPTITAPDAGAGVRQRPDRRGLRLHQDRLRRRRGHRIVPVTLTREIVAAVIRAAHARKKLAVVHILAANGPARSSPKGPTAWSTSSSTGPWTMTWSGWRPRSMRS